MLYIYIYIVCSCGVHKRLRGRDVFKGHPAEEGQGAQHMPEQEQCWRCTPCPHGSRRSKRRPEPCGGGRAAEAAHGRQRRRQRPRTTDQTHPTIFCTYIYVCIYICVSIIPSKAGLALVWFLDEASARLPREELGFSPLPRKHDVPYIYTHQGG